MLCYSQEDPVQQEDTPDNEAETFDLYLTSPDITALIFREVTPRTTPLFHQTHSQLSWLVLWLLIWSSQPWLCFTTWSFPTTHITECAAPGIVSHPKTYNILTPRMVCLWSMASSSNGRRPHGFSLVWPGPCQILVHVQLGYQRRPVLRLSRV